MKNQTEKPKIAIFNTKKWVVDSFGEINKEYGFEMTFHETRLCSKTVMLAEGYDTVCVFVNDELKEDVVIRLKDIGVSLIALRCAGFNNVDIAKAEEQGITVVRVPAYSPYAVAEHTLGLILCLNRKLHKAYSRVRDGNFALDGLLGFDLHKKTIGVIGTGKIGKIFIELMQGFGCTIIAYDIFPDKELEKKGIAYVPLNKLYSQSDIISLHCPLNYETYHMINEMAITQMKDNVMIINTSRGKLIDTTAAINGLKQKKIGYLGLDVYEEEEALFFEDLSETVIQDDQFVRLQTFPNVLITAHQAFFTKEAIQNISATTFANIKEFYETNSCKNKVVPVKK